MPTPSGKLKAGDLIRWEARNPQSLDRIGESLIDFIVVERTGNDLNYAVWVKRVDGKPIELKFSAHTRSERTEMMLIEAHYQIHHGPFRLLSDKEAAPLPRSRQLLSYEDGWKLLHTWALREKELVAANPAQSQTINAVLHRMDRFVNGDPEAFETILHAHNVRS